MITEFVKAWNDRKDKLRRYLGTHKQSEYDNYTELVRLLFDIVINPSYQDDYNKWNLSRIHVIDDGDYQGTLLFIIPRDRYQPNQFEYVVIFHEYGSCSGCDTLQGISEYDKCFPTDKQLDMYMTLMLHLLQRCKYLFVEDEQ